VQALDDSIHNPLGHIDTLSCKLMCCFGQCCQLVWLPGLSESIEAVPEEIILWRRVKPLNHVFEEKPTGSG
jgi:hypothetical protein